MKNINFTTIIILYVLLIVIYFAYQHQDIHKQLNLNLSQQTCDNIDYENVGIVYFDSNNVEYPIFDNAIDNHNNYIRKIEFEINEEMDIISKFIKRRNNRIPEVLADIMSYHIFNNSRKHNIPIEIIIGIIEVESFYNPFEISSKKARGLTQVLDREVDSEEIDHWKLHEINYNIDFGMKILKSKLRISKGDVDKALYLYVGRDPEYSNNVLKVMGQFRYFRSQILKNKV